MIVSGGTYRERVISNDHAEDLGGSGFRAVSALPSSSTTLVTAIEADMSGLLRGAASTLGFDLEDTGRDKAVGFTYSAPFVEPVLHGASACLDSKQSISGDNVLAFGLVEKGERSFDVESLVYDPQSVSDPGLFLLSARRPQRLAICANALETVAIGRHDELEHAARNAADRLGASVVITKAGARGCLVTDVEAGSQHWMGAVPTNTVRKLGSGDVFTAAFAHAWFAGATALEAAKVANLGTAWWCGGYSERIPKDILSGMSEEAPDGAVALSNDGRRPRIYLAGPFFTSAERWLVDQCLSFLTQAGADVFSPVHEIGLGGPEVAARDLEGLSGADAVFAILDGWDPGTLFETGWAVKAGIPVVAAGTNLDHIGTTMLAGSGAELHSDFTSALYRSIWVGLKAPVHARGVENG